MNIIKVGLENGCECYYIKSFFDDNECNNIINHIESSYNFIAPKIKIFGKVIDQPRETVWIGPKLQKGEEDRKLYKMKTEKIINDIRKKIENKINKIQSISNNNISFNACLINRYDNGKKSVGYHDDLEENLEKNPYIASLSLGSTRKFKLKNKKSKNVIDIELNNGDLIVMGDKMQDFYWHSVPKTAKNVGIRYNLTFRKYIE